jgi:hypothetical protein
MLFKVTESVPECTHLNSFETYVYLNSILRLNLDVFKAERERRQFL